MVMNQTALYTITTDAMVSSYSINELWNERKGTQGFCPDYVSLCAVTVENRTYIAGYDPNKCVCNFYEINSQNELKRVVGVELPQKKYSMIRSIYIGNSVHLIGYNDVSGEIDFYRINRLCALEFIFGYRQTYGLVTSGFTALEPYYYRDDILMLGYNGENGTAVVYRITVPALSPIVMSAIWTKGWAPGWCRFAFFQFGEENFFLKSNPLHNNVNIDHMMDDPVQGSYPVGTHLPLSQDVAAVAPVTIAHSPYFISYLSATGEMVVNRIDGDCRGWKDIAAKTAVTGGCQLVGFTLNGKPCVMIY